MTSQIFFRFKNAISQDQVLFDGSVIQIGDIKRLIAVKRGLGAEGAAELTLFDSSTNDEYTDDGKVIPRNSLVIVKRAPVTKFKPLQSAAPVAVAAPAPAAAAPDQGGETAGAQLAVAAAPAPDEFGGDYYSEQPQRAVVGEDEEKALQSLLQGTAATWKDEVRRGAMRGRGRGRGGRGAAPLDYRCSRCDAVGQHWVQDCPTQGDPNFDRKRIRPPVGIPMTRLAKSDEGGLILPDGQTGTLVANEDAFAREILGLPTAAVAKPAAAARPAAETDAAAAGAQQQQEQEQVAQRKEGPAVLLLDSKPHEAKPDQANTPTAAAAAALPSGGSQLVLPRLAGDEELVSPVVAMPGASFFNVFMQSVLMPRGPPDFLVKAFNRDEPLPRSEFEQLRDEYRRRFQMPPLPGGRAYSPGKERPMRSRSPQPARSGKEGPEASRRSRGPEQRGRDSGERGKRSRSRSRERRRSRERGDSRRRSSPQRSSRTEDKRRSDKEPSRSERSRRTERESEERARKRGRSRDRSSEREHRRNHRRWRGEEAVGTERWQPTEEPPPVAPASSAGMAQASQPAGEELQGPAEHEAMQSGSPVAAPADVDARRQPRSPSQPAVSSGAQELQVPVQQENGTAAPGSDVQVSGAAAAGPQAKPAAEAAPPGREEEPDGDRHRKRHKKEKKEKKEKREKKEKKEKKEKRKHRPRSRSVERSSEGGEEEAERGEAEEHALREAAEAQAAAERAQRTERERMRREEEEAAERGRREEEAAQRAQREAAEREQRRAQRRAVREAALGPRPEEGAAGIGSRDKKLGPRLFDRAIVAAMRDKRGRSSEEDEVEERAREGEGRERSSKHSKHSKRR